ncbi:hypothetical protein HPS57_12740 [Prevotella sp. PINT]|uniref:DUF5686 family protein n=1 Tax=Palleniella intestinalis TaxID=2736291 RepID=UPI001555AF4E|nr:DUF5686 family protein [Palleniella intestinalis]NPD82836.1 hypothetical protein [Palleniella intestinalis]
MCRKGIVIYVIMSCLVVASAYGCKTVHDVSQQKVHGDSTEIAIGQVPAVDSVQVAVGKGSMMFTEETMRNAIMECRLGMSRSHAYEKVTRYEKLEIAVNDVNPLDTRKRFFKSNKWIKHFVEHCGLNGKFVLPILTEERVEDLLLRRNPARKLAYVRGIRREGANEMLYTDAVVNVLVGEKYADVNVMDSLVKIDGKRLVSPLSSDATSHYCYEPVSCNDSVLHLFFAPKEGELGFSGEMIMEKDSLFRLRHIKLMLPKPGGSRSIDNLYVVQEFGTHPDGKSALMQNDVLVEMKAKSIIGRLCYIKSQRYSDYSTDSIDSKKLKGRMTEKYDAKAEYRPDSFWARYDGRSTEVTDTVAGEERHHETYAQRMLRYADDIKSIRWLVRTLRAFVDNKIPVGVPSVFNIGPTNSLVSFNDLDNLRLRIGGHTTSRFSRHLFLEGYYAHGFRFHDNYYQGRVTYSFIPKTHTPYDYPCYNISLEARKDIGYIGERSQHPDRDDLFSSYHWDKNTHLMYYDFRKIEIERDAKNGMRFRVGVKTEHDIATGGLLFKNLSEYGDGVYKGGPWTDYDTYSPDYVSRNNGSLRTSEVSVGIEYAPRNGRQDALRGQLPINSDPPAVGLSHTWGIKGFLGGQYDYHITELKARKRFFMGDWGFASAFLKGSVVWSKVPYPLLLAPQANMSYVNDEESFSLITPSELINDRYVQLFFTWEMNSNLIGVVDFIRRWRWKEYFSLRMLWGGLSAKNNPQRPENWNDNVLMAFPEGHSLLSSTPYVEGVVGIHNILNVFNIDYVHRFSYRRLPNSRHGGIRFSCRFNF